MRIHQITAKNFVGAHDVDVTIDTPVTLFAGQNGAGKSSLKQAIDAALLGHMGRVTLKKEYGAAVSEGAKKGLATVETDAGVATFALPDGKHSAPLTAYLGALPFLLEPSRFARATADERRTFLFELTGLRATPEVVKKLLLERQCDEKRIEAVLPMLRAGFPAAVDFVKDKAKEAKGAWKGVTGEQWGKEKSEGWAEEVPRFDAARHAQVLKELESADARLQDVNREFGALHEKHRTFASSRAAHERNLETAQGLVRLEKKLEFDKGELAKAEQALTDAQGRAGSAPRKGLVHELASAVGMFAAIMSDSDGVAGYHLNGEVAGWDEFDLGPVAAAMSAYEKQYGAIGEASDEKARESLPTLVSARDTMLRSVANDERDIAAARAAEEALKLTADADPVSDEDLGAVRTALSEATNIQRKVREELDRLNATKQAADAAAENTKKAAAHHADVIGWLAIADALSPDGIPGDMLSKALEPINTKLADFAHFAAWPVPWIDSGMAIRAGERLYSLLSESEQYRVDALLALTIGVISETKLVSFDRFDVLDLTGRSDLLALLDDMATQGELETALVFATLKKVPEGLNDTMRAHWIADGELLAANVAEAA
ncbi:AAA family ATPase [Caballeronia sp. LZ033]|uniref:AAA family ATPase n=1 Tax=Caballeronia sp. LZ033 TaxID=3038566 RepID=UPI0028629C87|nr:AAA family ATPase [Caballeronia sp. LZ033]MDR5813360.1 AAA family ATPase [Caballeronia sp. LZ033]